MIQLTLKGCTYINSYIKINIQKSFTQMMRICMGIKLQLYNYMYEFIHKIKYKTHAHTDLFL